MKLLANISVLLASVVLSGIGYAQTVTVNDSGFETPAVGSILGGVQPYVYDSSSPNYLTGSSGWYVSAGTDGSGSVTLVNQGLLGLIVSPITNDSTGQYLALNGLVANVTTLTPGALGGISQVIATTVGQEYQVTYLAAALSLGIATTNTAQLSAGVDGVTVTNSSGGGALLQLGVGTFTNQSFTFTATSTQSTLDFSENQALLANVGGVAIDNVSVTAVPEPSHSAAILICGAVIFSLLRRHTDKANAYFKRKLVKI